MDVIAEIFEKYKAKKGVIISKMFGSQALKVNNKVFIIIMKNGIVFKLHPDDVKEALSIKGAGHFDAHKNGKKMKEWIQFPSKNNTKDLLTIAEKSYKYITGAYDYKSKNQ